MRLEYGWTGTDDRGDGEADLELEHPSCPQKCGGDAYRDRLAPCSCGALLSTRSHDETCTGHDPEREIWKCSDCDGEWDGYGDSLL